MILQTVPAEVAFVTIGRGSYLVGRVAIDLSAPISLMLLTKICCVSVISQLAECKYECAISTTSYVCCSSMMETAVLKCRSALRGRNGSSMTNRNLRRTTSVMSPRTADGPPRSAPTDVATPGSSPAGGPSNSCVGSNNLWCGT